jgi:ribonuclease P protein component
LKLHRFPKSERLRSKKIIDSLFSPADKSLGGNVFLYPFKIFWLSPKAEEKSHFPQVIFSIPKKHFKKATDRNRLRRQIKEVYRTHKSNLFQNKRVPFALGIVYIAKEKHDFSFIKKKLMQVLEKMLEKIKDTP